MRFDHLERDRERRAAGGDGERRGSSLYTVPEGTFPERTCALRVEDARILVGSADGVWTLTR